MRRDQRPRSGARRDDGIKVIRTDEVRYPDVELPPLEDVADEDEGASPLESGGSRRLGPARDTGIAVDSRVARAQRERDRGQRRTAVIVGVVAIALLAGVFGWRFVSDRRAAATPITASSTSAGHDASANAGQITTPIVSGHAESNASESVSASTPKLVDPTPIFARYGRLMLRLPVPLGNLTEVGFHQASYSYARPMTTRLKDANLIKAAENHGTGRKIANQPTGLDAWLIGSVLRMWRARPGLPNTAADVGALAGTPALSPVTGTVVKVKPYLLYGRYPDLEVHIHADGCDDVDVVMIHLKNLVVTPGTRVEAGITPIGSIRKFSDKFHDQLADFTRGGGDHVHIQVNNANDPIYKGLKGAISPNDY